MKKAVFVDLVFIILIPFLFNNCSKDKTLPLADFYVQSQGNLVGENVSFFDNSKNQPIAWEWSFPGGTPSKSTLKDPIVVYSTPGKYNVTLTATNSDGSNTILRNAYISVFQFDTFTDSRDGKTYKSMMIGNDKWMIENLNFTTSSGSYVYAILSNYATLFGRVYDWVTAQTVAPQGWHLPSDSEFTALVNYLGGTIVAGGKMKSGGTTLWMSPNTGATNLSGFNALPAGGRYSGSFTNLYTSAFFWTSTYSVVTEAWSYAISYSEAEIHRNSEPRIQCLSVRCVKDK